MATNLCLSVIIIWLALALSALSICLGSVGDIVTSDFFDEIFSAASYGCAGKTIYTYTDFINAANAFSSFGTTGTRKVADEFVYALAGCVGVSGTVFTVVNSCSETIWPGVLTVNNGPNLAGGGFALTTGQSTPVNAPAGWSGRFWGRTGCNFDASGAGSCATGDCMRGLNCNGADGAPPATLAEFTIGGDTDFYDVSLVDGYNVPLNITTTGGTGNCGTAGCVTDLRSSCPAELSVKRSDGRVIACMSACRRYETDEYCCKGAHNTPDTCSPTDYSKIFKAACPTAYSYAYDDQTSTFTCSHADYTITFCP